MGRILIAVLAAGLLLAGSGTALAEKVTNETVPLDMMWVNPCNGEFVRLVGSLHLQQRLTEDEAGGFHTGTKSQPITVYGVGSTTGVEYHGLGVTLGNWLWQPSELSD